MMFMERRVESQFTGTIMGKESAHIGIDHSSVFTHPTGNTTR